MRKIGSAVAAVALLLATSTVSFAGTDSQQTPQTQQGALMPGGPAGVQKAALYAPVWVWVAGVGFVALGVGLVASGNGHGTPSTTTTGAP